MVLPWFNEKLKGIYFKYKNDPEANVPLKTIEKYLKSQGVELGEEDD